MQHESISAPTRMLFTAVSTAQRLSNHIQLCQTVLEAHSDDSAALTPIVETLSDCGTELQQLHTCLNTIASDTDQQGGEA